MLTAVDDRCPDCRSSLTSVPENDPWCGDCEWNLGEFPVNPRVSWFWGRIRRADQRAGFRSGLELARTPGPARPDRRTSRFLAGLSAAVVLVMLALIAAGVGLIVVGGPFFPVVFGVGLISLGVMLRPRFNRLRPLLRNSYRVERTQAPTVYALIDRIAGELDAPVPDTVLFDFDWNASVTLVGVRRRVMRLGVPLMLALRPQELVALLGHELGHLKHDDVVRSWLEHPARFAFGRLSRFFRPPQVSAIDIGPHPALMVLLLWQLTGGVLAWLLFAIHLAINGMAARNDRAVELRADAASARVAGSAEALRTLDLLAMLPVVTPYMQHHVAKGDASASWRRIMRRVLDRESATAPAWRQLSMRTSASMFAAHPAPGRRHQWLAAQPPHDAAVVVTGEEAAAIEAELRPYGEALHRTMLRDVTE